MPGRTQIILLACLCAAALAGCASEEEGTIPTDNSENLLRVLDGIEEDVAGGNCELAQDHANEFLDGVNDLPAEVDDEVKQGLREGAEQLVELSDDPSECEETTGETGFDELEPTTEPTTTETPTTTDTTTTETEEEPEEDAQQQEEPPAPPEDENGGPGSGGGPPVTPPGGEGTVTIEPPSEDDPTSGGIGGDKGPRR